LSTITVGLLLASGVALAATVVITKTFTNPNQINIVTSDINEAGQERAAEPYPSTITVRGFYEIPVRGFPEWRIRDVNLKLIGLSHTWPDDVGVLLVGPRGQTALVMSDVGGVSTVSGLTLTLDDQATNHLPDSSLLTTGTYMPTQGTNPSAGGSKPVPDNFPFPAPPSEPEPYGTNLFVFNGTDPNGTWSLYVIDDTGGFGGQIANGWSLQIRTPPDTTAPKVNSTSPANGAMLIAPGANVTATFSEAMDASPTTTDGDPSTINGTTFKLMKAGTTTPIGALVSYNAMANKAILNPNANLQLGTKYRAVVTTGAQDVSGNRLDQDQDPSNGLQQKAWTFTIRN
jgi:large repetitive protein